MIRLTICDVLWVTAVTLTVENGFGDEPDFYPGLALRAAVEQIEQEPHLVHKVVHDDLSKKWLVQFLEGLDPHRMYFLAEDIELFRESEDQLDDLAKAGSFALPQKIRKPYRDRVAEAVTMAIDSLAEKHDFTVEEQCSKEFRQYASSAEELRERWRLRIKLELLIEKAHGRSVEEAASQMRSRYQRIGRQARDMSDQRLCELYIDSLATVCDPRSSYYLLYPKPFEYIPWWTTGLRFRNAHGRIVIAEIALPLNEAEARAVVGWELLAIRRTDGSVYDIVEMPLSEVADIFQSIFGPLKKDERVILELLDPVTLRRRNVEVSRLPNGSLHRAETVG